MNVNRAKAKLRVRVACLEGTGRMFIVREHLESRKEDATGFLMAPVGGHEPTIWWVQHDKHMGGEIAAYSLHELEELACQTPPEEEIGAPPARSLFD